MNEVRPRSDSASPIRARDKGGVAEGNSGAAIVLREPSAEDGPAVSALIAASPPLDGNSAYCNLLQCSDFAGTCVVAEREGRLLGWISAYRPPSHRDRIFVWQVGDFLDDVRRLTPEVAGALHAHADDLNAFFAAVTPISVDVGVLERSDRVVVLPAT